MGEKKRLQSDESNSVLNRGGGGKRSRLETLTDSLGRDLSAYIPLILSALSELRSKPLDLSKEATPCEIEQLQIELARLTPISSSLRAVRHALEALDHSSSISKRNGE
jgi:hypothetical protein